MTGSSEAALEQIVATWGIEDPPEVAPIRTVSPEEFQDLFASCMAAAGFPQGGDGGYNSAGQDEAFATAMYTCTAQYPIDDIYTEPLTDAQMRFWYSYLVEEAVPCYESNGWPVEQSSIPSEELFIATFGTADGWAPYVSPPPTGMSPAETERIQTETCPVWPPSEELYSPELLAEG